MRSRGWLLGVLFFLAWNGAALAAHEFGEPGPRTQDKSISKSDSDDLRFRAINTVSDAKDLDAIGTHVDAFMGKVGKAAAGKLRESVAGDLDLLKQFGAAKDGDRAQALAKSINDRQWEQEKLFKSALKDSGLTVVNTHTEGSIGAKGHVATWIATFDVQDKDGHRFLVRVELGKGVEMRAVTRFDDGRFNQFATESLSVSVPANSTTTVPAGVSIQVPFSTPSLATVMVQYYDGSTPVSQPVYDAVESILRRENPGLYSFSARYPARVVRAVNHRRIESLE